MKTWGLEVTPKDLRIDPDKRYRTRDGKRVIGISIKLRNSNGNEVTFPVKGSIVVKEKPLKTEYHIWTLDGRSDLFKDRPSDLIEVKE